jgi:hypothetical protein
MDDDGGVLEVERVRREGGIASWRYGRRYASCSRYDDQASIWHWDNLCLANSVILLAAQLTLYSSRRSVPPRFVCPERPKTQHQADERSQRGFMILARLFRSLIVPV